MSPEEVQQEIVEEFAFFSDWADKYEYIIEQGKTLPAFNEEYKIEENKVKGCQSHVWLHAEHRDGRIHFEAESEALIVKGLVQMLLRVYNDQSPEVILQTQPHFIDEIGMRAHLSPTRSNGLSSMVKHIKSYALGYHMKAEENAGK